MLYVRHAVYEHNMLISVISTYAVALMRQRNGGLGNGHAMYRRSTGQILPVWGSEGCVLERIICGVSRF